MEPLEPLEPEITAEIVAEPAWLKFRVAEPLPNAMVETLSVTLESEPLRVPTLTVPTEPAALAIFREGATTLPPVPMFRVPPPTPP